MKKYFAAALTLAFSTCALGVDPDPRQAEITSAAVEFVRAYERADAKAIAEMWTPDGDLVDLDGRVIRGRKAIEKAFTELFRENQGQKVRIEVASVRFLDDTSAIEDGTTSVIAPDGSIPDRARYTNVLVKRDGKWLLASVREFPFVPPSNGDNLRPLDWMLGEWVDSDTKGHEARVVFERSPDKNFILSTRAVRVNDNLLDNGTQRIGWDAGNKSVRSWSFEPDGGFGESTWSEQPDGSWLIKTNATLQSGHKTSYATLLIRVDPNTVTFQVKDQQVDGKPAPDMAPVTMKRAN